MKLFNIAEEYKGLYDLVGEVETDENGVIIDNSETIMELYIELQTELEDKLNNSAYICKELTAGAKALKDEAKRLTEKARALESREKKLKELMKSAIVESGEMKHKTEKFSFSVRTIENYNYDDVAIFGLDSEFVRVKEEIDKTKVKAFVKAGGTIDGLRISEDTSLTVR